MIESGRFTPTGEGTPQGGVISPCLLNVALHGMEHAAGVRYRNSARSGAETVRGCPVLVRYADDYVAMCYSREQAGQVQARLAAWLEPRGLRFNQDKTRIVRVEDGFSFLGFDIRRHVDRIMEFCTGPDAASVHHVDYYRLAADPAAMLDEIKLAARIKKAQTA